MKRSNWSLGYDFNGNAVQLKKNRITDRNHNTRLLAKLSEKAGVVFAFLVIKGIRINNEKIRIKLECSLKGDEFREATYW